MAVHASFLLLWFAPQTSLKGIAKNTQESPDLYSPFPCAINQTIEHWPADAWDNSVYIGPPSRKLDAAWDVLQAVEGISVVPDEAAKLNSTSKIMLKNGDKAVILGYFHNLHYIRYLYQGLHPGVCRRGGDSAHAGLGHCITASKSSVVPSSSQPDLTLHTTHWQDEQKQGMDLEPDSRRECVDFSAIYDFSMTRSCSTSFDIPMSIISRNAQGSG